MALWTVMQLITHRAPVSRASLAKQTGLSKQTVSELVKKLEDGGFVRETGRTAGHVGRAAVTYEIVASAAYIASVDLGGTKVCVSIIDFSAAIKGELYEPTDPRGGSHVIAQVARMCAQLAAQQAIDIQKLHYAVIGVPGVPEPETGKVLMAPNIRDLDNIEFTADMARALGVPVAIENDVNLAALGEHWALGGKSEDSLAFAALGTGIGGGIVIDGKLVRGANGAGGEFAYLPFGADPFEEQSRVGGALERQMGSDGIRTRYRELSGREKSVPDIFLAAGQNDVSANQVLDETANLFARLAVAVSAVINPSMVVIGGSIGQRPELFERVRNALDQCAPYPIRLEPSRLQNRAALMGGAVIGLKELHTMFFAQGLNGVTMTLPSPAQQQEKHP